MATATPAMVASIIAIIIIGPSSAARGHLGTMRIPFGPADVAVAVTIHCGEHFTMAAITGSRAIFRCQPAIIIGVHAGEPGSRGGLCLCTGHSAIIIGIGNGRPITRLGESDTASGERQGSRTDGEFSEVIHDSILLRRRRKRGTTPPPVAVYRTQTYRACVNAPKNCRNLSHWG
jgi:hypothetical protein